ncbi:hypothetical protein [Chelatococcus reniformis]|uniref:Uncharacterized protein n=1 Tax=Chelatococcus reniformis TaxID=1494448 RepID=A0A916UYD3_9HYPH|nr:hypothetical protein [Chelatococcus reniformis]GGC93798.1 hypothetical protein GCM10010994_59480 [Chelatococcus reniformis]
MTNVPGSAPAISMKEFNDRAKRVSGALGEVRPEETEEAAPVRPEETVSLDKLAEGIKPLEER